MHSFPIQGRSTIPLEWGRRACALIVASQKPLISHPSGRESMGPEKCRLLLAVASSRDKVMHVAVPWTADWSQKPRSDAFTKARLPWLLTPTPSHKCCQSTPTASVCRPPQGTSHGSGGRGYSRPIVRSVVSSTVTRGDMNTPMHVSYQGITNIAGIEQFAYSPTIVTPGRGLQLSMGLKSREPYRIWLIWSVANDSQHRRLPCHRCLLRLAFWCHLLQGRGCDEFVPPQDPCLASHSCLWRRICQSWSIGALPVWTLRCKLNVSHSSSSMDMEEQPYLPFDANISLVKDILGDKMPRCQWIG